MDKIISKIESQAKLNKILLVGTGGGSDIFSSLLIARILATKKPGIEIHLAGVLSPSANHTYIANDRTNAEVPVCRFTRNHKIVRKLDNKEQREITMVDNVLWDAIDFMGLTRNITSTMHFSLQSGWWRLQSAFKDLIKWEGYDCVIAVDVGGDILLPLESKTVLSPIMDWSILALLQNRITPTFLLEFGFGLDGESKGRLMDNIAHIGEANEFYDASKDVISEVDSLRDSDGWEHTYTTFKHMFERKMASVRIGHTIPGFILYADHFGSDHWENSDFKHTHAYKLGGETVFLDEFTTKILADPCTIYLVSLNYLCPNKTEPYNSPLSYALWLKGQNKYASTEMDGQEVTTCRGLYDWDGRSEEKTVLLAALSFRIESGCRETFIKKAYERIGNGIDGMIVFKDDIKFLPAGVETKAIHNYDEDDNTKDYNEEFCYIGDGDLCLNDYVV